MRKCELAIFGICGLLVCGGCDPGSSVDATVVEQCTVKDNGDGTGTMRCPDGTSVIVVLSGHDAGVFDRVHLVDTFVSEVPDAWQALDRTLARDTSERPDTLVATDVGFVAVDTGGSQDAWQAPDGIVERDSGVGQDTRDASQGDTATRSDATRVDAIASEDAARPDVTTGADATAGEDTAAGADATSGVDILEVEDSSSGSDATGSEDAAVEVTDCPGTSGSVLAEDTVWSGPVACIVANPLLIPSGRALTVTDGAEIRFEAGAYIKVEGTLIASGTQESPVLFASNESNPTNGAWGGIRFRPNGGTVFNQETEYVSGSRIHNAMFEHAEMAIYVYGTGLLIEQSKFQNCEVGLGLQNVLNVVVNENLFQANHAGVRCGIDEGRWTERAILDTRIWHNLFRDNGIGIQITNNANCLAGVDISFNQLLNSVGCGISWDVRDAFGVRIENNWVLNNDCGVRLGPAYADWMCPGLPPQYGITLANNILESNTLVGLTVRSTIGVSDLIEYNVIVGNGSGLYMRATTNREVLYSSNTIVQNRSGISIDLADAGASTQLLFNNNTIQGNVGDPLVDLIAAFQGFSGNNLIHEDGDTMANHAERTIEATGNWWGTTVLSEVEAQILDYDDDFELGQINVDPILTSPSTSAPVPMVSGVTKTAVEGGIQLTWDALSLDDLAGYRVHWGERVFDSYESTQDAGILTTLFIADLNIDTEIAVTAYDASADGNDDLLEGHEGWFVLAEAY